MSQTNNPNTPEVPVVTPEQTQEAMTAELRRIPQLQRDAIAALGNKLIEAMNEAAIAASLDQVMDYIGLRKGDDGVFYVEISAPGIELPHQLAQELSEQAAGIGENTRRSGSGTDRARRRHLNLEG